MPTQPQPVEKPPATRPRGERLPVVVVLAPRCPRCQSADYRSRRSVRIEAGSAIRWCTCRDCQQRFRLEIE